MRQQKVMQINITCGVGSTGRIAAMLYHAACDAGYDVSFAYSTYTSLIKTAFCIETSAEKIIRRALNRLLGKKQIHSNRATKRLIRYIEQVSPDVIHIHNIQHNFVDYRAFFAYLNKKKIPVVYTLHDCWSFTGGCYHFTEEGCNQYQSGCLKCPKNTGFDDITIATKDAYACKAKLIGQNENIYPVCVSRWLCDVATKSYMGGMKHVPQVVYNGIDVDVFYPRQVTKKQKCNVGDEQFVILGVASYWNEAKGLSLFSELAKRLSFPVKIILIGGGLEPIKALSDERFICIDRTENVEELAEYYSLADVFINTSIEETFGLTTAEALACGTPAIVFASTACPEVIDERSGICVPFDMEALVGAVCEMRAKGKPYYAAHCRERIEKEFSKENMVNRYLELYRSVLHDGSAAK